MKSFKLKVKAKLGIVRQLHVNSGFNLIHTSNYLTSVYGNIEGATIHLYSDLNLNVQGRSTGGRGNSATAHEPEDYDSVQLPNVSISFPFVSFNL